MSDYRRGRSCKGCEWHGEPIGGYEYECRRYPPQLYSVDDGDDYARFFWPVVGEYDWCGEFVKRAEQQQPEAKP